MSLLATGVLLGLLAANPAAAQDAPLPLQCQASPPIIAAQTFSLDEGVTANAPSSVTAGSTFAVSIAPDALTVPVSVSGYTVNSISGLTLTMPIPTNATLNGVTLSGGSGLGSGTPNVSENGTTIVLNVPGPIAGGSSFTLPKVTLDLTAGASGTTIDTRLAGSSYADPGLTFTASVPFWLFTLSVPTACYPSPNPVLSSTTVQ
ncbi:cyclase [Kitasatospora mediocidica]|uniref:cyclase n=1 Tax=Kitasatospora mediocidica TaxID=58352 RepID=UPI000ABC89BC|nr:cyclase [Kitasatospora mediocidica]